MDLKIFIMSSVQFFNFMTTMAIETTTTFQTEAPQCFCVNIFLKNKLINSSCAAGIIKVPPISSHHLKQDWSNTFFEHSRASESHSLFIFFDNVHWKNKCCDMIFLHQLRALRVTSF